MIRSSLFALLACPALIGAQEYRISLETSLRTASYRGWSLDSIDAADAVVGNGGGLFTPDGIAVDCTSRPDRCQFFRPGEKLTAIPVTQRLDASVWSLAIDGLSFHVSGRGTTQLGDDLARPIGTPPIQLREGFARLRRSNVRAEVGRLWRMTSIGQSAFDGAAFMVRPGPLEVEVYGGLGLDRAVSVPVNSEALNPLDEYRPSRRELTLGASAAFDLRSLNLMTRYERSVDRRSDYLTSEVAAADLAFRPARWIGLRAGVEYDLALGATGTSEAALRVSPLPQVSVEGGWRRYMPRFDLWTIWGAFSPVAYEGWFGSTTLAWKGVSLGARGELFEYDPTMAATSLARFEDDGFRWSVYASYVRNALNASAAYFRESSAGAAADGVRTRVSYRLSENVSVGSFGAIQQRPLELRFTDSRTWSAGADFNLQVGNRIDFRGASYFLSEDRVRPDATSTDLTQVRFSLSVRWEFASRVRDRSLRDILLMIPEVGR